MRSLHFPVSLTLVLLTLGFLGCERSASKRTYTEKVAAAVRDETRDPRAQYPEMMAHDDSYPVLRPTTEEGKDPQALLQEMIARGEDPHAAFQAQDGLGTEAQARLKQMIENGQDPHAFLSAQAGTDAMKGASATVASSMGSVTPELMASVGNAHLNWTIPAGWIEKPAGGMRMASFASQNEPGLDISVVAIGGGAGGKSANINRWLGQIKAPVMSDPDLEAFLAQQEKWPASGGFVVQAVDLTVFKDAKDPTQTGILAGMIELPDQTIFLKMSGSLAAIEKNRAAFKAFCQSLKTP